MPLTINGKSLQEALRASLDSLNDPRVAGMAGGALLGGAYGAMTGQGFRNSTGRALIGGATGAAVGYSDLGRDAVRKLRDTNLDIRMPRLADDTPKTASFEDAFIMGMKRGFDWRAAGRELVNRDNLVGSAILAPIGAAVAGGIGALKAEKGNRWRGAREGAVRGAVVGAAAPFVRSAFRAGLGRRLPSSGPPVRAAGDGLTDMERLRKINAPRGNHLDIDPATGVVRRTPHAPTMPGGNTATPEVRALLGEMEGRARAEYPAPAGATSPASGHPGAVSTILGGVGGASGGLAIDHMMGGKYLPVMSARRIGLGTGGGLVGALGGFLTNRFMRNRANQ